MHQHTHSHGGGHGHSHGGGGGHSRPSGGQGHSQGGNMRRSHSQSLVASPLLSNGDAGMVYVTNPSPPPARSLQSSQHSYGAIGGDVEQGRPGRETAVATDDETSALLSSSEWEARNLGDDDHHHDENINVKAAFIHVLGDLLQSIGVLVAAFIIYFKVGRFYCPG